MQKAASKDAAPGDELWLMKRPELGSHTTVMGRRAGNHLRRPWSVAVLTQGVKRLLQLRVLEGRQQGLHMCEAGPS